MANMRYEEITLDKELPNFRTKEEIISQTETTLAISYIEKGIEQLVNFLGMLDYDYDLLIVSLQINGFIKEGFFKRNHNVELQEQEHLEERDILDDYVSFTCEIDPFKYEKDPENIDCVYSKKISEYQKQIILSTKKFIVNYNEFINMINQLGYSIDDDSKDFKSIKDRLIRYQGSIEAGIRLDFTRKNKSRQH